MLILINNHDKVLKEVFRILKVVAVELDGITIKIKALINTGQVMGDQVTKVIKKLQQNPPNLPVILQAIPIRNIFILM